MFLKRRGLTLLSILTILTIESFAQPVKTITLTNPVAFERKDELIVLTRSFLAKKLGIIPSGQFVQIQKDKQPLVVQFDDFNGDGIWDEAVFLYSFQPREVATITVTKSANPATVKAVVRAHVRQRHKLPDASFAPSVLRDTMPYNKQNTDFSKEKLPWVLTEGPAWENDKVGFRKYFDVRNANDVWGKVTTRMVLDEVGIDPTKIYHHFDSSWGMDILKVGKSLGAGGLALLTQIGGKDTAIRFGGNVGQETYEQITDGPVRAIFRMNYSNWKIGGLPKPIKATEEISIWGGQYFFQNKVTVTGAPAGATIASGINDFYIPAYDSLSTKSVAGIYTWGRQSENADNLGLAILSPIKSYAGSQHLMTGDISNAFVVKQSLAWQPVIHRFFTGWEKTDHQFTTKDAFVQMMNVEAAKMGTPILIK